MFRGLGFRVLGLGFSGLGFRALGFRNWGLGVRGSRFRGLGFGDAMEPMQSKIRSSFWV